MSKQLEMYELRVLPYNYAGIHGGVERTYEITVKVNGQEFHQIKSVPAEVPPHMSEIEVLNRMTQELLSKLKQKHEAVS